MTSLGLSGLLLLMFAFLAIDLPKSVPLFLGVMSLPPHMDHKQFRMFSAVMLQGRESHYQRDIADLKARLMRGGTGDLSQHESNLDNAGPVSGEFEPAPLEHTPVMRLAPPSHCASSEHDASPPCSEPEVVVRRSSRKFSGPIVLHGDFFRTFIALAHQKGMDNDELVAGLSLHLGMPVSSPMKLHHDGDSFLRSVSKESYGRGRRGPRTDAAPTRATSATSTPACSSPASSAALAAMPRRRRRAPMAPSAAVASDTEELRRPLPRR